MNQVGAQRAIKNLIDLYSDVLVSGHYQRGTYRTIKDVIYSVLTPPRDYYHVGIQIRGVNEASFQDTNTAKPKRVPVYDCMVRVVERALPSGDEGEEQYFEAHAHFRSMVEGMVSLIAGSYWATPIVGSYHTYFEDLPICIQDPESNSEFSLVRGARSDRLVKVQNLDHTWFDPNNEVWTPLLISTIQFNLMEQMV
jgi:hypothetical protein